MEEWRSISVAELTDGDRGATVHLRFSRSRPGSGSVLESTGVLRAMRSRLFLYDNADREGLELVLDMADGTVCVSLTQVIELRSP